jgi:hypothetical protein
LDVFSRSMLRSIDEEDFAMMALGLREGEA